ncbi:MAG: STAS domain-containing protein [Oleiphilaceae bacterium]|nr:STAS domain-containing protein [Oleiphilaceae bacterium]
MSDAFHFDAGSGCLRLLGELTVYQIRDATEVLRQSFGSGQLSLVDLGGVTEMDTAGLQLLLLAKSIPVTGGAKVALVNHSPPVREVIELAGLSTTLDVMASARVSP